MDLDLFTPYLAIGITEFSWEENWEKDSYLFEIDVSIAAKGRFDVFCPLSFPLGVFLSP